MAKNITKKEENYSQWYLDVIKAAELADYAPVRGCMVVRPQGYGIWENIQSVFDRAFKETGHVNAYFPMLIPNSFMEREAKHVEGFAPECAVVTHAGGAELEEPYVVRPTSETIIGHMYSQWVQSWRDLPILINQWCSVMRWEKRPRLFLRTSEFLWHEGHTAHATAQEAVDETLLILDIFRRLIESELAISIVHGFKSENERFPGADDTYTCEAMMSDRRALQAGTSHFLGQNFSKAFDISFQDQDGEVKHAWTTSWAVSSRLIGALIMTHADNDGLVLPPRIATTKAIILPISSDEAVLKDKVEPAAVKLEAAFNEALGALTTKVDKQYHMRPGDRFFYHLQRGVPLRVELGEKEYDAGTVTLVRRDTGAKESVPIAGAPERAKAILEDIQSSLFAKAVKFREDNTFDVGSLDELRDFFKKDKSSDGAPGFARARFGGTTEDEKNIKDITGGATIRCFPLEDESTGKCIVTGRDGARHAIFGKAY